MRKPQIRFHLPDRGAAGDPDGRTTETAPALTLKGSPREEAGRRPRTARAADKDRAADGSSPKTPVAQRIRNFFRNRGGTIVVYFILVAVSYIFLYPLMNMISTSFQDIYDQINPLVIWFPESIYWENYRRAWIAIGGTDTYLRSLVNIGVIAVVQTVSSALIGYALAKFDYWWNKVALALIIMVFIFPRELFLLPQYTMMTRAGLIGTIWPVLLLSMLGHGTKNAIFILIYYSFFRLQPPSLDEAAYVDGAGHIRTFLKINLPMAKGAVVVNFILSFVWNWNDTDINGRFFAGGVTTVQLKLQQFTQLYERMFPYQYESSTTADRLNFGVEMAGAMLTIIPLIIAYFVVQRYIVEGIENTGITGE